MDSSQFSMQPKGFANSTFKTNKAGDTGFSSSGGENIASKEFTVPRAEKNLAPLPADSPIDSERRRD